MTNEVATIQTAGPALFRASTDAAGLCRAIVLKTARKIQGRQYVQVEGWQAIAIAHGCIASAGNVERVEGGFRAIGRVLRMDTGQEIATAEGFVGDDESMWAKRPEYARRAMAQTRAISRACRAAFAHVVVMMDAGLQTTPAEEVPDDGFEDSPVARATPQRPPLDLALIRAAETVEQLQAIFTELYRAHPDKDSRAKLVAAKDARKAELTAVTVEA